MFVASFFEIRILPTETSLYGENPPAECIRLEYAYQLTVAKDAINAFIAILRYYTRLPGIVPIDEAENHIFGI